MKMVSKQVQDLAKRVQKAAETIAPYVKRTRLVAPQAFGDQTNGLRFKLETEQNTGSFKARGATHRLLVLSEQERQAGVVTASSGNHGLALSQAAKNLGIDVTVFVPTTVSEAKRRRILALDSVSSADSGSGIGSRVELLLLGDDGVEAENAARRLAEESGRVYISPYNDLDVVAGQGSVAVELFEQWPDLERVYVTVGGGGLISGMAAWLAVEKPGVTIVGCQPLNSAVMARSLEVGQILDLASDPTLSDGSAGGIEAGSVTFDLCRELIDEMVLINEKQIAGTMVELAQGEGQLVEGAAAVAAAAWKSQQDQYLGQKSVVVLCGRNVSLSTFKSVLRASRASRA